MARYVDLADAYRGPSGVSRLDTHTLDIAQRGERLILDADRTRAVEDGSYRWRGELRLWVNEALIGWYRSATAPSGQGEHVLRPPSPRHPCLGRWVGLSYDGLVVTGWSAMARSRDECDRAVADLIENGACRMDPLADVTVTASDADWLASLTRDLVAARLAACGNVVPSVRSLYAWQGAIEDDCEALVILHTRASLVPQVIEAVERAHPYDTPQVIALPVLAASDGYHRWVLDSTLAPSDSPVSGDA